jgi:hypothetical protein
LKLPAAVIVTCAFGGLRLLAPTYEQLPLGENHSDISIAVVVQRTFLGKCTLKYE